MPLPNQHCQQMVHKGVEIRFDDAVSKFGTNGTFFGSEWHQKPWQIQDLKEEKERQE